MLCAHGGKRREACLFDDNALVRRESSARVGYSFRVLIDRQQPASGAEALGDRRGMSATSIRGVDRDRVRLDIQRLHYLIEEYRNMCARAHTALCVYSCSSVRTTCIHSDNDSRPSGNSPSSSP